MPKPYEPEFKERALRMLAEALPEHASVHAASKHVGGLLGISPDVYKDFAQLRRLPDLLFPRRCPFCGSLLGPDALQGTVCPACVPEEMRLQHIPARLPEGEHDFYAVREAAAAYYYEDIVRTAVLRCKRGGCFWYARELADRVAVLVFGALPAKQPGKMPQYAGVTALPLYSCIVPVPPRQPLPGMPGLPLLLARRLGAVLGVPVETPLYIKRRGRPQKELTREQRLQNARGAFGCRPGTDLTGRRVLLIDERANFVVRETWSDPATGAYAFLHINPEIQYLVISYDYQQNFRAAVADNLTAEPMP